MKTQFTYRVLLLALAAFTLAALAYARKYPLTSTPIAPGAKGSVDVDKDRNGNTEIDLKVEFLPKPASLTPPAETYIVWFRQQGSQPEPQGQLKVNDDLKGEFRTTTAMRNFDVLITAEAERLPREPSGQEAMHATVQEH